MHLVGYLYEAYHDARSLERNFGRTCFATTDRCKRIARVQFSPVNPINAHGEVELQLHIPTALPPRKMFLVPIADERVWEAGTNQWGAWPS